MISASMKRHVQDIVQDLECAISNDTLSVQYQPRYDCVTGDTEILEALVRWQHPDQGMIPPDRFIHIAEQHGLICKLGLWVFERCCRDISAAEALIGKRVRLAVNVSLVQCEDFMHAQKMFDICNRYGLDLSRFEFELTESGNIANRKSVIHFCETLAALGAEISLDDFGTSYSPLNNLFDLPVSYIKVDRGFTLRLGKDKRSNILIKSLIKLAHKMNIKVVVEGVENEYQRELLIDMGCDQIQGFLMCRPVSLASMAPVQANMLTSC